MKKLAILGIVALMLVISLAVAVPSAAAPPSAWQLVGTAYGGPWVDRLGPCFDVEARWDNTTAYLRVKPFPDSVGVYSYDPATDPLETVNFAVDADNSDSATAGDFIIEYWHSAGNAQYHEHDGTSYQTAGPVAIAALVLPAGMAVVWDDGNYPAHVTLEIPVSMIRGPCLGLAINTSGNGGVATHFDQSPGPGYHSWDMAHWVDVCGNHGGYVSGQAKEEGKNSEAGKSSEGMPGQAQKNK